MACRPCNLQANGLGERRSFGKALFALGFWGRSSLLGSEVAILRSRRKDLASDNNRPHCQGTSNGRDTSRSEVGKDCDRLSISSCGDATLCRDSSEKYCVTAIRRRSERI